MPKIIDKQLLHQGFLSLYQLRIQEKEQQYHYEFLEKKDAVVVLVIEKDTQAMVLVKQWRPIDNGRYLLECVAGNVEADASPVVTAIKEVYEEIGYELSEYHLQYFGKKIVTPGCLSEHFHLFIAEVNSTMQTAKGGGVANEHEQIEIVKMPIDTALNNLEQFDDLKTYTLMLLYKQLQQHTQ